MAEMKPIGIDQTTGQQRAVADADTVNFGSEVTIIITNRGDYLGIPPQVTVVYPFEDATLINEPATAPAANISSGNGANWSPNGEYLSIGSSTSPYIQIYQRTGNELNKLDDPASLPIGGPFGGISWAPDGELLTVSQSGPNDIINYQRSGNVFTRLTSPASIPGSGSINELEWSGTGEFLAIAPGSFDPKFFVYRRDNTTLTKIADPASLPQVGAGFMFSCGWSPDSRFLALGGDQFPRIFIYERTGIDDFTLLPTPSTTPSGTQLRSVQFSPNGEFLATMTGSLLIYQRSGNTFTGVFADSGPYGTADLRWSPDSRYLAIGGSSDTLTIFERDETAFTLLDGPSTVPANFPSLAWSPDGQFLTAAHLTSVFTYQTGATLPDSGVVKTIRPMIP